MKLRLPFLMLGLIGLAIVFLGHSSGAVATQNADRTGSPFSIGSCGDCHHSGTFNPSLSVALLDGNTEVNSYVGGQTYTMRFTVSDNSAAAFGFQAVALNGATNEQSGSFSNVPSGAQVTGLGGREYAEHSQRSTSGVWEFEWTAPDTGSGSTKVYMSGNAVNNADGTTGDSPTQLSAPVEFMEETSSTHSLPELSALQLAPNPVQDLLRIELTNERSSDYQLQIVNIQGQVVSKRTIRLESGLNQQTINTADLTAGMYQLVITDGKGILTDRFLKQ